MSSVILGDICDFINGGAWSDKEYVSQGIPVLKVTNCKPHGFQIEDVSYLPFESEKKYSKNKLFVGDVIIATVGSHPTLVNSAAGRSCVVTKLVEGYFLNQNAVCLRTKNNDILEQRYLGYLCKSKEFQNFIQNKGRGAANQMRIAIGSIKEFAFNLSPIELQRHIADILSAYDNLIENNQKQIKLLEEAAQKLYKEWFVDLRFPGYENTPIINGVPQRWNVCSIVDLCEKVNAGGTPSRRNINYWSNATIKWYKTQELQDCWLVDSNEKISIEGYKNSSARFFPTNTILMAIYASPTLGRLGILDSEATCNQAALCLKADESKISWQWLYGKLYELRDYYNGIARGAGQQNISGEVVKQTVVLCPAKEIMDKFTQIVSPFFEKRRILQKQIIKLAETRDRLLPKLMSGELEE